MSRTWRIAAAVFAVAVTLGAVGIVAVAVGVYQDEHSKASAIDAQIDAQEAQDSARDARVFQEIDADNAASTAACENAVRDELVSPSSAQFSIIENSVGGPQGNLQGTVTVTVDSQNSYGAMMHSNWTCVVPPGSSVGAMHATVTSLIQR